MDESVWFDHFYYSVICPIFYVETLADLSKKMRGGRTAEKEVAKIADKVPEVTGNPCPPHAELCIANPGQSHQSAVIFVVPDNRVDVGGFGASNSSLAK